MPLLWSFDDEIKHNNEQSNSYYIMGICKLSERLRSCCSLCVNSSGLFADPTTDFIPIALVLQLPGKQYFKGKRTKFSSSPLGVDDYTLWKGIPHSELLCRIFAFKFQPCLTHLLVAS